MARSHWDIVVGDIVSSTAEGGSYEVATDPIVGTIGEKVLNPDLGRSWWFGYSEILLLDENGDSAAATVSGTITKISIRAGGDPTNGLAKFRVWRSVGDNWEIVYADPDFRVVVEGINEYTVSIPVLAGDYIGFYCPPESDDWPCGNSAIEGSDAWIFSDPAVSSLAWTEPLILPTADDKAIMARCGVEPTGGGSTSYFGEQGAQDFEGDMGGYTEGNIEANGTVYTCPGSGFFDVVELSSYVKFTGVATGWVRLAIYSLDLSTLYAYGTARKAVSGASFSWQGHMSVGEITQLDTLTGGVDYAIVVSGSPFRGGMTSGYHTNISPPVVSYYNYFDSTLDSSGGPIPKADWTIGSAIEAIGGNIG